VTGICPQMGTIAVFGGGGGVGSEAVFQGLNNGDKVVTLVRDAAKVVVPPGSGGEVKAGQKLESPDLRVVVGDVTKAEDVDSVFENGDVTGVVVALGGKTSEVGVTMLQDGTKNIINSMEKKGVKRISIVTSIGANDSYDQAPFLFKVLMWTALKDQFADKNVQEDLLLKGPGSGLEYTIVRPAGLGKGPPTGAYQILAPDAPETAGSIERSDVAGFCLRALKEDTYVGKAWSLTGKK